MPIPKRKQGQSEDTYIPECIAELVGKEGMDNSQAAAICYQQLEIQLSLDPAWRKSFINQPAPAKLHSVNPNMDSKIK